MPLTNFPDGISVGSGVDYPLRSSSDYKVAQGTAILSNAGTVDVTTGLSSVLYAVVSPYGALSSTAGTVGGFVSASSEVKSAGVLLIRGNDQFGTASTASGTASWIALGT